MNKIEEFYKEAGGIEYDKFDKKADKFTYYDMIGFADAYHSKQLIIADVSNCINEKLVNWLEVEYSREESIEQIRTAVIKECKVFTVTYVNGQADTVELVNGCIKEFKPR